MSTETVQLIIARAVTDVDYREMLFNQPEEALQGFELSEEEHHALMNLQRDHFESVQSELEERLSKAGFGPGAFSRLVPKWGGDGGDPTLRGIMNVILTHTDQN